MEAMADLVSLADALEVDSGSDGGGLAGCCSCINGGLSSSIAPLVPASALGGLLLLSLARSLLLPLASLAMRNFLAAAIASIERARS